MPATYEPIATTTLGSATNSFTLSSIPSGYTDLKLVLANITSSVQDTIRIRVNGDTGNNYSNTSLSGDGSAATSSRNIDQTSVRMVLSGAITTSNPAMILVDLFSYSGSTNKTMLISSNTDKNGSTPAAVESFVGLWRSTSAINSITVFFLAGTTTISTGTIATLYGILKA